ncbi:2-hydroxyacid dehydrogenase [Mycoplasmopsis caviae]|uniref:2-hydroxyacid dehydrogenase n=1 Tax=Mycoplasmopsis caviae TaxID=55603 RepID=A0A3P8LIB9_9BACT|nr:2-hydroxyacid dehydrogenase [Mycoplasmopsis caviae]UUD34993.1 2-hydroxyacid dehydrogenase [Mycoplasmopsis caviae]VDR42182.1 D-lactate dehydrogenase [Mycoplasmopsis caviae]
MKIAFFDAKEYDKKYFNAVNNSRHQIEYFEENLNINTVTKAKGFDAVCAFVNTYGDKYILELLAKMGVKVWLQRSMGYNKVDLTKAAELGIKVFRVPNYSAESVAEFAAATLMAINRNIVKADRLVSKYNFSLNGLDGKAIYGSTVGVIGAGKIGQCFIKIMKGMGARVLVFDSYNEKHFPALASELGFEYVSFTKVIKESDFISLHAPLLPSTNHLIDKDAVKMMKKGVILVNTARGELIDIPGVLYGLKKGIIRGLASDVLEREEGRFYQDISVEAKEYKKNDPEWEELISNENVIITSHQAFLTDVALTQIAKITLDNADSAQNGDFSKSLVIMENGKVRNG